MRTKSVLRTGRMRIAAVSALCMAGMLLLGTVSLQAAEEREETTYTVRIFAGDTGKLTAAGTSDNGVQGVISGGSVETFSGLKYGDMITFTQGSVTVNSDKYYVKSELLESGKDYQDTVHPPLSKVAVTKDMDYVVSYGIRGNSIGCTVNYVDQNGQKMAESETFYGNVGDKPVLGSRYIEGYYPDAYNKTLTLKSQGNEVTFTYQPIVRATPTPVPAVNNVVINPAPNVPANPANGTGTADTGAGGAAGNAAAAGSGEGTANEGAAGNENAETGAGTAVPETAGNPEISGNAVPETSGETSGNTGANALPASPEEVPEIIDIDEENVPLAGGVNATETLNTTKADDKADVTEAGNTTEIKNDDPSGLSHGAIAGLIVAAAAAVAIIIVAARYLLGSKKE